MTLKKSPSKRVNRGSGGLPHCSKGLSSTQLGSPCLAAFARQGGFVSRDISFSVWFQFCASARFHCPKFPAAIIIQQLPIFLHTHIPRPNDFLPVNIGAVVNPFSIQIKIRSVAYQHYLLSRQRIQFADN